MKIKKRILSVLLALALCLSLLTLMPITAGAIAPHNPSSAAVWKFTSSTYNGGGSGSGGGIWNWYPNTKTLVLNNFSHTSTAQIALELPTDATIELIGANTLISTNKNSDNGYSAAIYAGNLTIKGSGSLYAKGGNAAYGSSSYGIECAASLTISENATVTAAGGNTALGSSRGIICVSSLTISENASVTATGGTSASGISCGFSATSGLTLGENASLTAIGGTRSISENYTVPAGYKYYVNTTTAASTTPLIGNGTTTVIGSTHKYARISPLEAPHTHSFGEAWLTDASGHWHACECGEKSAFAAHTPGNWIVDTAATATTDGSQHKDCTTCGYITASEKIPATGGGGNAPSMIFNTKYESNFWNWFKFIVLFGFIWMWF